jgi:hypothetical protein
VKDEAPSGKAIGLGTKGGFCRVNVSTNDETHLGHCSVVCCGEMQLPHTCRRRQSPPSSSCHVHPEVRLYDRPISLLMSINL